MKAIISKTNNAGLILLQDTDQVSISKKNIKIADDVIFGLNSSNCVLVENVPNNTDWASGKYKLVNNQWQRNPDWTEPVVEEEPA